MEHVACMEEMRNVFWLENLKGKDHSEDLGIDSVAQDGDQW
jgi:hypothetical protein